MTYLEGLGEGLFARLSRTGVAADSSRRALAREGGNVGNAQEWAPVKSLPGRPGPRALLVAHLNSRFRIDASDPMKVFMSDRRRGKHRGRCAYLEGEPLRRAAGVSRAYTSAL